MTHGGFFRGPDKDPSDLARRVAEHWPPRRRADALLRQTLLDEQLEAIKALILRNRQADAATRIKLDEIYQELERNPDSDSLEARREDVFWRMVFQEAAHSMSAVGMLAPFIESLFVAIFEGLRERDSEEQKDTRRQHAEDQIWNPQIVFRKDGAKSDLVAGIDQLAETCGLKCYLPPVYHTTLTALFAYRNNMLHNGFEWPPEATKKFGQRIASEKWPKNWFSSTEKGSEPWLYYMTPEFCGQCVKTIDGIIEGTGRYLRDCAITEASSQ